jgi:oligopeptide/dipeptide ABC transporter ATP-binding protein
MNAILKVKELSVVFHTFEGRLQALDRVGFDVFPGETLGIVGESGCGKSVTSLSILRLIPTPPGEITGGSIDYRGTDILALSPGEMRSVRGQKISMIFQEPMTSLSPVFTVGEQISEVYRQHKKITRREAMERSIGMLKKVNIPDAPKASRSYPHEMSGGMRQRVMIAMALACKPELLIADEPTTALDVTIQAQVIDLIKGLQSEMGMSVIFITHDLGVVANTARRVVVMYMGRIVEEAAAAEIFGAPLHPYTRGLMHSIPRIGEKLRGAKQPLKEIKGVVPSLFKLPQGCTFSDRCGQVMELCRRQEPELVRVQPDHRCRCWLHTPDNRS